MPSEWTQNAWVDHFILSLMHRITSKPVYVALLLVALAMATGATFARLFLGPGDPPFSMSHPEIEYLFSPSQDARPFGNRVLINEYGMRNASFPRTKMGDEFRVLVLGDSVINGGNLTDHEQLAATLVSRELSSVLGKPVIIANASAGSWGPANQLAYIRRFGLFDADAVVVILSSDDAGDDPTSAPLNPTTHPTRKPTSALWEGVTRYLPGYIPLWQSRKLSEISQSQPSSAMRALPALTALIEFVQKSGRPICVLQHLTLHELTSRRDDDGFGAIKYIATQYAVVTDSTREVLLSRLSKGKNPFRDDVHLNDEGQAALAVLMASVIKRCVSH